MTRRRSGLLLALGLVSWGGLDVRTAEAQCSYTVSPATVSAPSTGLNSSISVITGSSCAWTATSAVPWITVTSPGMSGLGSISFSVAANGTGVSRTGILTVAGRAVTVTQSAGSCNYSVSPASVPAPAAGLIGSITVITGSSCAWTATSTVAWIAVTSGASMSGLGSVAFTVASTTTPRTGTLIIAGQTVTVTQSATDPPLAPENLRIVR